METSALTGKLQSFIHCWTIFLSHQYSDFKPESFRHKTSILVDIKIVFQKNEQKIFRLEKIETILYGCFNKFYSKFKDK